MPFGPTTIHILYKSTCQANATPKRIKIKKQILSGSAKKLVKEINNVFLLNWSFILSQHGTHARI